MPITDPIVITSSHLRWPIPIAGQTYYWIETAGGDFVSRRRPDIYDASGAPTNLSSELAAGSVVRVEADDRRLMSAVQLIAPVYDSPFARLIAHLGGRCRALGVSVAALQSALSPQCTDYRAPD